MFTKKLMSLYQKLLNSI